MRGTRRRRVIRREAEGRAFSPCLEPPGLELAQLPLIHPQGRHHAGIGVESVLPALGVLDEHA